MDEVVASSRAAVADIGDGATSTVGELGLNGIPSELTEPGATGPRCGPDHCRAGEDLSCPDLAVQLTGTAP